MIHIRRILCPTDFSEFSSRALEHAVPLAQWYGASITTLYVHASVPPPPIALSSVAPGPHLSPEIREEVLTRLCGFAEPARRACLEVGLVVVEGDPAAEIAKESKGADLVVMGTHGRSGFEALLLGSVAEKVLRKCACPVLTVPRHARGTPPGERPMFKNIVCCVDFSEASLKALELALSLAREADSRLRLLHVVEWLPEVEGPEGTLFDLGDQGEALRRTALERLRALIPEGAREWCRPEAVIVLGKAYRAIVKAAQEPRADLIVMGVTGRGAFGRVLFGSTTAQVVREAACPVLTIRADRIGTSEVGRRVE